MIVALALQYIKFPDGTSFLDANNKWIFVLWVDIHVDHLETCIISLSTILDIGSLHIFVD